MNIDILSFHINEMKDIQTEFSMAKCFVGFYNRRICVKQAPKNITFYDAISGRYMKSKEQISMSLDAGYWDGPHTYDICNRISYLNGPSDDNLLTSYSIV